MRTSSPEGRNKVRSMYKQGKQAEPILIFLCMIGYVETKTKCCIDEHCLFFNAPILLLLVHWKTDNGNV